MSAEKLLLMSAAPENSKYIFTVLNFVYYRVSIIPIHEYMLFEFNNFSIFLFAEPREYGKGLVINVIKVNKAALIINAYSYTTSH